MGMSGGYGVGRCALMCFGPFSEMTEMYVRTQTHTPAFYHTTQVDIFDTFWPFLSIFSKKQKSHNLRFITRRRLNTHS